MEVQHITSYVTFICMAISMVSGFPLGAPAATCLTMFPEHEETQTQHERDVYVITTDSLTYMPNQHIKINITSPMSKLIKGVQVRAHRTEINQEEIIGRYENLLPAGKLKHISCQGRQNSIVTHANDMSVPMVEMTWVAPDMNLGPIIFELTVVESFYVFYYGLKSAVIKPDTTSPAITYPVLIASTVNDTADPIDWGMCGETKGCLLYPRYCTGSDCKAAVSFVVDKTSNTATFEMMVQEAEYVALGFSDDNMMGDDQVISCSSVYDRVNIQHGWNHPMKFYVQDMKTELSKLEATRSQDGGIYCRFTRPVFMNLSVTYDMYDPLMPVTLIFDLNRNYYLFIAWGSIFDASNVLEYHHEMPVISERKVDFFDHSIKRGSVMPHLIRAHSTMMAVAWMGFAVLAIATARHYKQGFKGKSVCGIKVWFHIHRISAIITAILTTVGLIVVLVHFDGKITEKRSAYTHMCLGFTVVVLVCAQIVAGFIRPAPDKKFRPIFNFIHRCLGTAALVIAAAAMICAYKIRDFSDDMQRFGEKTLAIWAGIIVFLEIVHAGYKYFMSTFGVRSPRSDEYNLDKQSARDPVPKEPESPSHILLAIYLVFIAGSITAAFCMTLFF